MKIIVILIILICVGCSQNRSTSISLLDINENVEVVDFSDIPQNHALISISKCIDSVEFIKLEVTEESLIKDIFEVCFSDSYVYVRDSYKGGSVLIFTKQGDFVKRIPWGNGPAELIIPLCMTYDEKNKELVVYQLSCFKRFSESGEYITDKYVDYLAHNIISLPNGNGYLMCQHYDGPNSSCNLFWVNRDFEVYKQVVLPGKTLNGFFVYNMSLGVEDNVLFSRWMDNNIYSVNNDSVSIKRILSFGNNALDDQLSNDELSYNSYRSQMKNGLYSNYGSYCETESFERYLIDNGDLWHCYYFSKRYGTLIGNEVEDFFEMSLIDSPGSYMGKYGNFFVSEIAYRDDLLNYKANEKVFSPEQMEMLKNFTENDNPIIMLYSLKDPE